MKISPMQKCRLHCPMLLFLISIPAALQSSSLRHTVRIVCKYIWSKSLSPHPSWENPRKMAHLSRLPKLLLPPETPLRGASILNQNYQASCRAIHNFQWFPLSSFQSKFEASDISLEFCFQASNRSIKLGVERVDRSLKPSNNILLEFSFQSLQLQTEHQDFYQAWCRASSWKFQSFRYLPSWIPLSSLQLKQPSSVACLHQARFTIEAPTLPMDDVRDTDPKLWPQQIASLQRASSGTSWYIWLETMA